VVLARQHGSDWYIAALNGQKEPLTLDLDLSTFNLSNPNLYIDNKKGEPTLTPLKLDKKGRVKLVLQPNGGMIVK
jgi:hypothetical protein